ncbi:SAM-dependent methyltransferase [Allobranchiibius huperziae]|uniref:SAM-dependent methyltransferase n=1 Tax=Allobranchiibius huperziae TaxID=1874116 RepID=A0A853D7K3_9MICO|nr:class I SAM-dependent methyltransferase [Allobranchiibius huperziae]NYJ73122.1 SAM-dependent methyltransferase [Allobranchiibius huperziae]
MTMPQVPDDATAESYWEPIYLERATPAEAVPSNSDLLAAEVAGLQPGRALDLGCAEGGDVIWLAQQGWDVLGVDVSSTALAKGAEHAEVAGVSDRTRWEQHDLSATFPDGEFDLVSAQFLHTPVAGDSQRTTILRQAMRAVAPGGRLMVMSHTGWPTWMTESPHEVDFATPEELLASVGLPREGWTVVRNERVPRDFPGPEGQPGTRDDAVLHVRRDEAV